MILGTRFTVADPVREIVLKIAPCLREAFRSGDIAKDVAYKIQITGTDGKKEIDKYLFAKENLLFELTVQFYQLQDQQRLNYYVY